MSKEWQKKNFERELPDGYVPVKIIDAKNGRTATVFTLLSLVPVVVCFIIARACVPLASVISSPYIWGAYGVFIGGMLLYIVLHELTHGLLYKILTGEKLTFGLTLTVAYCGVPDIYVYRRPMMAAVIAPFAVFTVVLVPCAVLAAAFDPAFFYAAMLLLGLHIGGCVGDLYDFLLLTFRYRDPRILLRDTGPKQTIFHKKDM